MNLNHLFQPQSIAVVGVSQNPNKIGHQIFKKLTTSTSIKVFPVNLKRKSILNHQCYSQVSDIPHIINQVIIAIPAAFVLQAVKNCIQKKVNNIVIVSAGFSESGSQGKKLESKLKSLLKKANISLLGPNCLGYANLAKNIDLTFAKTKPQKGNISIISQSGAIGAFLFDWAGKENLGFSKFVSLGNRADISEIDCLHYLQQDKQTKVIGLYLESFKDGKQFLIEASKLTYHKPVIVLFGGKTKIGHQAAQSHTAALAQETDVISTAIKQAGCIPAQSLNQFTDLLEIFSLEPPLTDNDLVIISNAGGPAILAADQTDQSEFHLTGFSHKIHNQLKASLPPQCQLNNPVDLLGDALTDRFHQALKIITQDKLKDAYLIILTPQTMTQPQETAKTIVQLFKNINKPVVVSMLGGKTVDSAKAILQKNNIATIDFPQKAVKYLNYLYNYYHQRQKHLPYPVRKTRTKPISKKRLYNLKTDLPSGTLNWQNIKKLAKTYSLPLIDTKILTEKNIVQIIKDFGYPLVLKSDPQEAIHRTEKKGLYLNLKTQNSVKQAFKALKKNFSTILAQPQIQDGVELFIGAKRHSSFPPMITIGSGGIYTEIYHDIAHAFLPLNKKLIHQLLDQTKIGQIIKGTRGLPPMAIDKIKNLLLNVSQMMLDIDTIQELDINPAIISHDKISIVDMKVKV